MHPSIALYSKTAFIGKAAATDAKAMATAKSATLEACMTSFNENKVYRHYQSKLSLLLYAIDIPVALGLLRKCEQIEICSDVRICNV
jgi:hypothetical protein